MLMSGFLTSIAGATFFFVYINDAVAARAGEPDQSLLFWYFPILFVGVFLVLAGAGLAAWGAARLRRSCDRIAPKDCD
jgi:hypothetical protein